MRGANRSIRSSSPASILLVVVWVCVLIELYNRRPSALCAHITSAKARKDDDDGSPRHQFPINECVSELFAIFSRETEMEQYKVCVCVTRRDAWFSNVDFEGVRGRCGCMLCGGVGVRVLDL